MLTYTEICDNYKLVYKYPEVWKRLVIDNTELNYEVSNYGKLRNFTTKRPINPAKIDGRERYIASIYNMNGRGKQFFIHRLIAMMFIPVPEKYINQGYTMDTLTVDHIRDGDEDNHRDNTIWNLQWLTAEENFRKAYDHHLVIEPQQFCDITTPNRVLTKEKVLEISKKIMQGKYSDTELGRMYGVDPTTITSIRNKRTWRLVTEGYDFTKANRNGVLQNGRQKYPDELRIRLDNLIISGEGNDKIYEVMNNEFGYGKPAIKSYIEFRRKKLGIKLKDHVEHDTNLVKKINELIQDGRSNDEIISKLNLPTDTRESARLLQYRREVLNKPSDKSKYFTNDESDEINKMIIDGLTNYEIIQRMRLGNSPYLDKINATISSRRSIMKKKK